MLIRCNLGAKGFYFLVINSAVEQLLWYASLHSTPVEKKIIQNSVIDSDNMNLWICQGSVGQKLSSGIWVSPQGEAKAEGLLLKVRCWRRGGRVLPAESDHLVFVFLKNSETFWFLAICPKTSTCASNVAIRKSFPSTWLTEKSSQIVGFVSRSNWNYIVLDKKHIFKVQVFHKCSLIIIWFSGPILIKPF